MQVHMKGVVTQEELYWFSFLNIFRCVSLLWLCRASTIWHDNGGPCHCRVSHSLTAAKCGVSTFLFARVVNLVRGLGIKRYAQSKRCTHFEICACRLDSSWSLPIGSELDDLFFGISNCFRCAFGVAASWILFVKLQNMIVMYIQWSCPILRIAFAKASNQVGWWFHAVFYFLWWVYR